jgi:hypothetical protein
MYKGLKIKQLKSINGLLIKKNLQKVLLKILN